MPFPIGRSTVPSTTPVNPPPAAPAPATPATNPVDSFSTVNGRPTAPASAPAMPAPSTAADPVERFRVDLANTLEFSQDPHVANRLPVEAFVAFAARANAEGFAHTTSLLAEIEAQRAKFANEPLTSMSLEVLSNVVRFAGAAPVGSVDPLAAATPREQLEAWLVLAAEGKRAGGASFDEWTAPYVIGTTDIPRSTEIVPDGIGTLLAKMTGSSDPSLSAKYLTRYEALDATKARAEALGDTKLNVITWGHSAGGPAAVSMAKKLADVKNVDVRKVVMLDPVNVLRLPPELPKDGVDVLSLPLGGVSFFEIGPGWRRWHIPENDARHVARVSNTDHFGMLGDLYDRGILQQAMAQALFRD
jgi:hypothetical protein